MPKTCAEGFADAVFRPEPRPVNNARGEVPKRGGRKSFVHSAVRKQQDRGAADVVPKALAYGGRTALEGFMQDTLGN